MYRIQCPTCSNRKMIRIRELINQSTSGVRKTDNIKAEMQIKFRSHDYHNVLFYQSINRATTRGILLRLPNPNHNAKETLHFYRSAWLHGSQNQD